MVSFRTDLASEAHLLRRRTLGETAALPGVSARTEQRDGFSLEIVEILNGEGEKELCKPVGRYLTLSLEALLRREEDAFPRACAVLAEALRSLLGEDDGGILVAGLGNDAITPDAVGPLCARHIMVTRHLKAQMPEDFARFREVSVFCSGVLGVTGLESAELVRAAAELAQPRAVIAVDALCAVDAERLCRTVQLSNAGIVPGSGVGNARAALNRETLGVPVIAVGVPTVVDAASLCASRGGQAPEGDAAKPLIVTPRDIDRQVRDMARLLGYSIDLALHPGLTVADVDMFLS